MNEMNPPAMIREVEDASRFVEEAKAADVEATAAEGRYSSPARWRQADAYVALERLGWTHERIAVACGKKRATVTKFILCSTNCSVLNNRSNFWEAFQEVNSEKKPVAHPSYNTGENEWYTPPEYLDAARAVLGGIDLDPASSDVAQQTVRAHAYFTKKDDGLSRPWRGRVWLNPPYASGLVEKFMGKLVAHHEAGEVTAAVCLVNNSTDTQWFRQAADAASAVCFPTGRVPFLDPQGEEGAPLQGQAVLYLGEDVEAFVRTFAAFGFCAELREPDGGPS